MQELFTSVLYLHRAAIVVFLESAQKPSLQSRITTLVLLYKYGIKRTAHSGGPGDKKRRRLNTPILFPSHGIYPLPDIFLP